VFENPDAAGTLCQASLHRSQISRFVSDAGSGSGTLRLRRKIPLLFGEKRLKQFVSIYLF
jgi:hypothetical protein